MPQNIPIMQAPEEKEIPPLRYIISQHCTRCANCNRETHHNEFWSERWLRLPRGSAHHVLRIHGSALMWNVPIQTRLEPQKVIAFCEHCYETADLSSLRNPPPPTNPLGTTNLTSEAQSNQATIQPRNADGTLKYPPQPKVKKTPTKTTVDDLLF